MGLLGLVALAPLAALMPTVGALALGGLAAFGALAAHARASGLKARCDKLSAELDTLSKRLLKAEAAGRADPAQAGLPRDVEELTVEIGLLSGIVRDLAAVVGTQDGEVARLKQQAADLAASKPAPAPEPPPAPTFAPAQVFASAPAYAPAPASVQPPVYVPPAAPEPEPAPMPVPRLFPPRALPRADAAARGSTEDEAVIAAFDGDGLEVHLQPLVTLPQRKVASYEALARLRLAGAVLTPEAFLPVLERHGRSTELDRRMLQRVATIARHLVGRGSEAAVAYGLSPLSLYEPGFLRGIARLVAAEPALAGRLVVALPQASWRNLDAEQAGAVAALKGRVGFTLDRPADLRFDAAALAGYGVGQVKVPAGLLLRPGPARRSLSDIAIEDLVTALARAGIRLVATDVAAESDVPDLIDLDVPFAQGPVFAPPRPVRADVLAAQAPPVPSAPPTPDDPPEPTPERRPFRAFLRRAS
ncbi:EAL domain-containing protein [Methylobacterium sp. J-092]|jgi:cyclic-di-GMP phosphodiesterase TipF (flagellum assembly factor)|uniref:EAL domain-containing protein n=1 Tax=Methylobacterium sp. J-092 TaxID=2836667 RepID=UPI001FB9A616|nr:EAL domain-containing protein [Methylobacterium sp. J-092]